MRVLIFSQHYWPESFHINDVALSLKEAGCQVSVLTGQPNYPGGHIHPGYKALRWGPEQHPAGYTIYRVPLVPRGSGRATRLALNYISFLVSALLLAPWLLRGARFDVVFVYGTSPILQAIAAVAIKRVKRATLVTWVQDLWPDSLAVTGHVKNKRLLAVVAGVVRWIYHRCDLLLVQSESFRESVTRMAGGTPVAVHHNTSASTAPASAEMQSVRLKPGFNIVFAGNLGTAQALDTVLDAAALLGPHSGIRWVLIGSGVRSDWLAEQISARGLSQVELLGRFAPSAMPAIFSQADALLVSLGKGEALAMTIPSKTQAYLAAGRPVLASMDGEGARVVLASGAGFAAPAEDAAALADAARRMQALTQTERQQMGRSGQIYFQQHFEQGRLTKALIAHFECAMGKKRLSEGKSEV